VYGYSPAPGKRGRYIRRAGRSPKKAPDSNNPGRWSPHAHGGPLAGARGLRALGLFPGRGLEPGRRAPGHAERRPAAGLRLQPRVGGASRRPPRGARSVLGPRLLGFPGCPPVLRLRGRRGRAPPPGGVRRRRLRPRRGLRDAPGRRRLRGDQSRGRRPTGPRGPSGLHRRAPEGLGERGVPCGGLGPGLAGGDPRGDADGVRLLRRVPARGAGGHDRPAHARGPATSTSSAPSPSTGTRASGSRCSRPWARRRRSPATASLA